MCTGSENELMVDGSVNRGRKDGWVGGWLDDGIHGWSGILTVLLENGVLGATFLNLYCLQNAMQMLAGAKC